jgi:hypothetical protein
VLPKLFEDPKVLIGFRVNAVIGAQSAHITKEGNDWIIRDIRDKPILGEDMVNPMTFPDKDCAKAYAEANGIRVSPFKEVKYVNRPKTKNDLEKLASLMSVIPKKEAPVEDCPF